MEYQSVNMMIQIEYCSGSTLKDHLAKRNEKPGFAFVSLNEGVIDREENLAIFTDVINGMAEIHKKCIMHRDLKPENIFIGEKEGNLVAKIGDFGLAWMLNGSQEELRKDEVSVGTNRNSLFSSVAGTLAYMAPEIRSHYSAGTQPPKHPDMEVNMKQDIYSLGLILYEICHKIKTGMQRTQLFRSLDNNRKITDACPLSPDVHIEHELILRMTERDPASRPSALEIIQNYLPIWRD